MLRRQPVGRGGGRGDRDGLDAVASGRSVHVAPQSDGGPGFVEVLASRLGETRRLRVSGPLDAPVEAEWVFDPGSTTAYLECAQACGLALLDGPPTPETALAAHSRGVGQLIAEALRAGARRIVVGLGGSACTDGGQGMIAELGGLEAAREQLADVELIAASDVEYPLLGPWGAARVFAPQKGADTADRRRARSPPRGVGARTRGGGRTRTSAASRARAPPAASAPGCSRWAAAASPARRSSPNTPTWPTNLAMADMIVTGEGRFDEQSLHGKVVGSLADAARPLGIPVIVLAGQVCLDKSAARLAGIMSALVDGRLRRFGAVGAGRRGQSADGFGVTSGRATRE